MKPIRVLVVDDSADFLKGASLWLSGESRIEVVATGGSGSEALELIETHRPELVLMDVAMPGMSGFEATRRIKSVEGSPHVLLLTFHESETARQEAWAAGADGLVAKADFAKQVSHYVDTLRPASASPANPDAAKKPGSPKLPDPFTEPS